MVHNLVTYLPTHTRYFFFSLPAWYCVKIKIQNLHRTASFWYHELQNIKIRDLHRTLPFGVWIPTSHATWVRHSGHWRIRVEHRSAWECRRSRERMLHVQHCSLQLEFHNMQAMAHGARRCARPAGTPRSITADGRTSGATNGAHAASPGSIISIRNLDLLAPMHRTPPKHGQFKS